MGRREDWRGDKRFQRNRTRMVFYFVARLTKSKVSQEGKINIVLFFFSVFVDRLRFVLRFIIIICSLDRGWTLNDRINDKT